MASSRAADLTEDDTRLRRRRRKAQPLLLVNRLTQM